MEWADSGDLAGIITERKRNNDDYFSEDQILTYFTQMCLGLKHCHDRKILHRNLNPNNIFVTRQDNIKLGAFGCAKVLQEEEKVQEVVGTGMYLPPEILERQPYDFKLDIWYIGVALYHLAALRSPWE